MCPIYRTMVYHKIDIKLTLKLYARSVKTKLLITYYYNVNRLIVIRYLT